MRGSTNPSEPFPLFNRVAAGIGGTVLFGLGVKSAVSGRIGDRQGWSMDAPVSAAIAGGLFALAGIFLVLLAIFWKRRARGEPAGEELSPPAQPEHHRDASGGTGQPAGGP